MIIKNTKDLIYPTLNFLVYGVAGAGKTQLIKTIKEKTIILSSEAGLLSLNSLSLEYIEINTANDLENVYAWLKDSKEAADYKCVAIDSLSEIAEVILQEEKKKTKEPRQAYLVTQDYIMNKSRQFRDLDKHVYVTCKQEKEIDELGRILYAPSLPGAKMCNLLPYVFDEVFALRIEKKNEKYVRFLQCQTDSKYMSKDRSGKLNMFEEADLGIIMNKILSPASTVSAQVAIVVPSAVKTVPATVKAEAAQIVPATKAVVAPAATVPAQSVSLEMILNVLSSKNLNEEDLLRAIALNKNVDISLVPVLEKWNERQLHFAIKIAKSL